MDAAGSLQLVITLRHHEFMPTTHEARLGISTLPDGVFQRFSPQLHVGRGAAHKVGILSIIPDVSCHTLVLRGEQIYVSRKYQRDPWDQSWQ